MALPVEAAARFRCHMYRLVRPIAATLSAHSSSVHEGSREESEVRRSPGPTFLSGCGGDTGPVGRAVVRFSEGAGPTAQ